MAIESKAKRGNPNWTNPGRINWVPATNSFEERVAILNLAPEEYVNSRELKEWARKHKDQKYVPTELLEAWGFVAESQ